MSYEDWLTHGCHMTCHMCGESYSESDGSCDGCTQCNKCKEWFVDADIDLDGLCEDCQLYCYRCERKGPSVEYKDFMYCPICYGVLLRKGQ